MRVAVLSDIHGNLAALEAVLDDLAASGGADLVIVAGDVALGGPQPRETLARLRSLGFPIVQGNTDRDLALDATETVASEDAELLQWTRDQLGPEGCAFLRALPFAHRVLDPRGVASMQVVHANPQNLDDQLQPYSPESRVAPLLEGLAPEVQALAFGHLHIPFVREVGPLLLANIASVGQPKDGDRRANYGLLRWDGAAWIVEQRRVEYPVDAVVALLREADPPGADELIKTLLRARYPNMTVARGGRAPKRRTPSRRSAVHDPQESEALAMQIGAEVAPEKPSRGHAEGQDPAMENETVSTAGREAGEPIAAHSALGDTPQGDPGQDAVDESSVAAQAEAVSVDEMVISDADLADPPLLPSREVPAETAEVAELEHATTPDERDAALDEPPAGEPIADDADLVYSAEDAAQPADADGSIDDDEQDEARAEREASALSTADGDDAGDRAGKKRRKKVRRAARQANKAETARLTADGSFAAVLPFILTSRLNIVLAQVDGVQADEDPEAVHDMRVATRRLRAALVAAEPYYGRKRYRAMSRSVRDLARALGQVRDADVLLGYLRARYMTVANDERVGLEGLIDAIAADRAAARDELAPVLDAWGEGGGLTTAFLRAAAKAKARGGKAKARDQIALVAARALDRDVEQFMAHAELLDDDGGSAEEFHELRIAGKKLRYTIELFAPVLGEELEELLAGLKSLQELLGEIHDRDVLIDLLAWERARALERQLHRLEFATFNPGTREERLQATRQILDAPDSFAATAIGTYGLLIDATIEREALEEALRERWHSLQSAGFSTRFHGLADSLNAPAVEREDDESPDGTSENANAE